MLGVDLPGAKQVFYGICLLMVIMALPDGIWPWLSERFGLKERRQMSALLKVDGISKRFRGLLAVDRLSFEVPEGGIFAVIGPNGAGKTTLFNMIAGVYTPDDGSITFAGARIDGLSPDKICQRGIGRTFQIVRPFPALSVEDNVIVGALLRRHHAVDARKHAP